MRMSQAPLHGMDTCPMSPSCLIPLPSGSHVPLDGGLFFSSPGKASYYTLLNSTVSIFSSGEINPRQPAL